MKNIIVIIIVLIILAVGGYLIFRGPAEEVTPPPAPAPTVSTPAPTPTPNLPTGLGAGAAPVGERSIGTSVENRPINAYHFGTGETELLFVSGVHGGYSWNTALLGYELVDYLEENPTAVPANVRVTVVPVLNPDGLNKVVGTAGRFSASQVPTAAGATVPGRFNANTVDLNRNFDCEWQATSKWQNRDVSGGTAPFSEPETRAIRDYVTANDPAAVVVYYSAAGGVYASACGGGVLPETKTLTDLYAEASDYPAYQTFDYYEITGDMVNWLAKEGVPGISILLTNHRDVEWTRNRAAIEALLKHYAAE